MENSEHEFGKILTKCTKMDLLNIIIRKCVTVLELFASEDQELLDRRNAILLLDLGLHVVDYVGRFNFESNHLPSEGLDRNLHTAADAERGGGWTPICYIRKRATIFELLTSKN